MDIDACPDQKTGRDNTILVCQPEKDVLWEISKKSYE